MSVMRLARWTSRVAAALIGFAALAGAPRAAASTLRATPGEPAAFPGGSIDYGAAPGEVNDVTIEAVPGGFRVTDPGATVTPEGACAAVDAHTALCDPNTPVPVLLVSLGDMDDRVTVPAALALGSLVNGDAGNDVLIGSCNMRGGPGDDVLRGCDGHAAFLDGGTGRDALYGGSGDDMLSTSDSEAAHDADVFDGGPGSDTVLEGNRSRPVTIDLSNPAAAQGEAREGDTIANVENAVGGPEPDTITGTDDPNFLQGGGGADVLRGLAGNDLLIDGSGADTVDAGPGDDRISTLDLFVDRVSCGDGADSLEADSGDTVSANCETVSRQAVSHRIRGPIGVRRDGSAAVNVACGGFSGPGTYSDSEFDSCNGTVTVQARVGGRWVPAGRAVCPGAAACPRGYIIRLPKPLRRLLSHKRTLRARATFIRAGHGAIPVTELTLFKVSRLPGWPSLAHACPARLLLCARKPEHPPGE
jgi:RTX calcium-binding nonapeptide repeat (4 copies)